ncbi:hypothetical protein CO661_00460 [Sinorhizobium fredii]|uniref:Integrase catalytic domain-containing protein n=1 Tax=Rhizobium fredii TaxID=380 RepID=A0A2A6M5V2_RHIFR|nr:DDE-type integrase/transposase/recombinase [Sinorhizobium fredii]PDT50174.1 hypothetical protein CO661_00460 [Sinorhizobium fredii]
MASEIVPARIMRSPIVKLGDKDRVVVGGQGYVADRVDQTTWTLSHEHFPSRKLVLSHADFEQKLQADAITIEYDYHSADAQKLKMIFGDDELKDREPEDQEVANFREYMIHRFEDEQRRGNKIPKTETALVPHLLTWNHDYQKKAPKKGRVRKAFETPTARHFSNWYNEYTKHNRNPIALAPRYNNGCSRKAELCPESVGFAIRQIRNNYMTRLKKKPATAYVEYEAAVYAENESRNSQEPPRQPLRKFSKTKFVDMIESMDAFQVRAAREGPKNAIEYFAPNQRLLETERPGQLVQFDDWLGDVITLFVESDSWDQLPEDFKQAFSKVRLWLCVAICTTTRCVLAVNWSLDPNGATAASTARMVMGDKRHIGLSVGAKTPWIAKVVPEAVTSDNGPAYLANDFNSGFAALGIKYTRPPAGKPKDRAFIESLFRTFGDLLVSYFDGRTFGSIEERGDYKASEHVTLAAEEFVNLVIYAILDIYHNRVHSALGTSPHVAWQIATENWPIRYHVSKHELLRAFGYQPKKPRKISRYGIVWMGVPYNNETLARELTVHGGESFDIRCDAMNLEYILVKGSNGWFLVKNRIGLDETVTLKEWLWAKKEYRRQGREQAKDGMAPMYEAINHLRKIGESARSRMGLTPQNPSEAEYTLWDNEVFGGWVAEPEAETSAIERRFALPEDPLRRGAVRAVPEGVRAYPRVPGQVAAPVAEVSSLDYNDDE